VEKKTSDYGLRIDFFSNVSNPKAKVQGYGFCQLYMLIMMITIAIMVAMVMGLISYL